MEHNKNNKNNKVRDRKPTHTRNLSDLWKAFHQEIDRKSLQKIRARQEGDRSLWFSLGMYGLVGWSIAIPTLLGIAIGRWLDLRFPSPYSWTLMGLFLGLMLGCWNAWYWIQKALQD
ncbi:AtpZ/AtpI family protein [Baaleninema simplex]|uniref:AtpZ/AtpI family protein n=1 Tax=Baaleninema simplex TaxID=2862350 RepID=UPI00034ABF69|nr:AtpZ/AtpI family protein [Baaleninema simplex]